MKTFTSHLKLIVPAFAMMLFSTHVYGEEIKVTVVAILGSTKETKVDERLQEFAKAVAVKDKTFTGFAIHQTHKGSLKPGETKSFELMADYAIDVTVNEQRDEEGRVMLTIKPPKLSQITYKCSCGLYFAMATSCKTKDGETLFVAISASPCKLSQKDKKESKDKAPPR